MLEVFMPRRSASQIRMQSSCRRRWYLVPASRVPLPTSLSTSTEHQIRDFERRHGLDSDQVARALLRWTGWARCPRPDRWRYGWQFSPPFADDRALLEALLAELRRPARRQLWPIVATLDARYRAVTVPDPFTPAYLPWWRRRTEL
ncbi:hypothetical protein [Dactylosporangium sp. NPDC006015]|uniref:hypothetical protein n=1 Tax=Dactylosporangium sp. NPDC006015 TaxID=3154576 RepID=UPI0033B21820